MGRKTTIWTFQATNKQNLTRKNLDMTKKGKLFEWNWISSDCNTKLRRKDYVKARIDKTQQIRCRLWHDWEGKEIYWKLCKKFEFDHTNKCYMHNSESVQENETQKILWDFEIQMDYLISAGQPNRVIIKKKKKKKITCQIADFAVPADHRVKQKSKKKEIST